MNFQSIKEIVTKTSVSKEEAEFIGEFINSSKEYIEIMKLFEPLQKNQRNLVKIWPIINDKIVAIVSMSPELNLDDDFFEQWFIWHYARYCLNNYYHNLKGYIGTLKSNQYKDWVMLNTEDESYP